jgi:molybdopterin-binding protein
MLKEAIDGRRRRMKLSARNKLKGRVIEVIKGATTAHVRLDIGGSVVTASITNEAVDDLGLAVGREAYAVVKASDVMIAVDD